MGIQLATAVSIPAVTYNRIHVTKLEIVQPVFEDDTQLPQYDVLISYRHYGVAADNKRYYMTEDLQRVSVPNFLGVALADAQAGDNTMLNALQSIEAAVSAIISDQTGNSTSIV